MPPIKSVAELRPARGAKCWAVTPREQIAYAAKLLAIRVQMEDSNDGQDRQVVENEVYKARYGMQGNAMALLTPFYTREHAPTPWPFRFLLLQLLLFFSSTS